MSIHSDSILWIRNLFATLVAIGLVAVAPSAFAGVCDDSDDDGICDFADNCMYVPNFDQRNTNEGDPTLDPSHDQFGNACDSDFDNDGAVSFADLRMFADAYGSSVGDPDFDADCDVDGDGVLGGLDWAAVRFAIGTEPGPSGR